MKRLSVSQLNMLIQREISFSPHLQQLEVEAEIGRLTRHASGHLYFTIKDAFSSIDCVMFRSQASRQKSRFEEGDRVVLRGQISIYEKTARLQFYVQSVEPLGDGVFLKAFQELKAKLEREGLLDPAKKRPIPRYPKRLALLTSPTGAARSDFLSVFLNKNPFCDIVELPVAVQGETVPASISAALEQLPPDTDLVVITRGGGSYEDLRFFNDEALARQVFALDIPTICAIGHEVDFTIIEFVADLRAATPTAAAEQASADVARDFYDQERALLGFGSIIEQRITGLKDRLSDRYQRQFQFQLEKRTSGLDRSAFEFYQAIDRSLSDKLNYHSLRLERLSNSLAGRARQFQTELAELSRGLDQTMAGQLEQAARRLDHFGLFLNHTNPLRTLGLGYSYLEQAGRKIQTVGDIDRDQPLINYLSDGRIVSQVMEVEHEL